MVPSKRVPRASPAPSAAGGELRREPASQTKRFRDKKLYRGSQTAVLWIPQEQSYCCQIGKQEKNMGEINLPASAPKASPGSLGLGRNISSVRVAPSVLFMGCLGPFLQHLVAGAGRDRCLG